jgi:hypothetical protein
MDLIFHSPYFDCNVAVKVQAVRGFNERQLKQLVRRQEVRQPRIESDESGYQLRFNVGIPIMDAAKMGEADGTLTTFRGQPKRFRSHRTLIRNMKKLGIARWRVQLDNQAS